MKKRDHWREATLGSVIEIFDHIRVPLNSGQRAERQGIYPYYGASGVIDSIDGYLFDGSYVLVAEDGENLNSRKLPVAFMARGKFWVNNHAHIIKGKPGVADDRFIVAWFASANISGYITGTAQPKLSQANLKNIRLQLPTYDAQRKIAGVISVYDDLIENNARRIAILEETAQALYHEWFVRFRFPGHESVPLVPSPLGDIPQEWKPTLLGDLAAELRRGVSPSEIDPETPYIGLEHLPRRSVTLCDWGRASDVQSTKLRFRKGEILFGKIRPYFHKVGVAPVDGVASSDAIVIVPKKPEYFAPVLCCVSSDDFVRHATQTSQGTKMPRANWDVLVKYGLPLPPEPLLGQFNALIDDIVQMLHNLMLRNRNLRSTRDHLLPKLIYGHLDVEHLDIDTGADLVEAGAMRFHFGNPNSIRTIADAVPLYGGGEFESPTRSTIPLLSLLLHAPEQFEQIIRSLGMTADSDLYLEYTVPPPRGRGNASHTDVMLRSGSKSLAIEAKWTEPLSDSVEKWLTKGESRTNKEAVLRGWLELLQQRLARPPFDPQDFRAVNYQMLHRAASAAATGSDPRLAYLLFTPSPDKRAARPDDLYRELGEFWVKLEKPFPFAVVEVQIRATSAYEPHLDLTKGDPATSRALIAALRDPDTPLFDFNVNAPRWVGEA